MNLRIRVKGPRYTANQSSPAVEQPWECNLLFCFYQANRTSMVGGCMGWQFDVGYQQLPLLGHGLLQVGPVIVSLWTLKVLWRRGGVTSPKSLSQLSALERACCPPSQPSRALWKVWQILQAQWQPPTSHFASGPLSVAWCHVIKKHCCCYLYQTQCCPCNPARWLFLLSIAPMPWWGKCG